MKNIIIPVVKSDKSYKMSKKVMMCYEIVGGKLQKIFNTINSNGNIMGVYIKSGLNKDVVKDIEYEFNQKSFESIFVETSAENFANLVNAIEEMCFRRKIKLYVPFEYANVTKTSFLVFKTAISGGNLKQILEYKNMEFKDRFCTYVKKTQMEFDVPQKENEGRKLESVDIEGKEVYFSENLCTNYFTKMTDDKTCVFTIFDDENSLKEKVRKSFEVDIKEVFIDEF